MECIELGMVSGSEEESFDIELLEPAPENNNTLFNILIGSEKPIPDYSPAKALHTYYNTTLHLKEGYRKSGECAFHSLLPTLTLSTTISKHFVPQEKGHFIFSLRNIHRLITVMHFRYL